MTSLQVHAPKLGCPLTDAQHRSGLALDEGHISLLRTGLSAYVEQTAPALGGPASPAHRSPAAQIAQVARVQRPMRRSPIAATPRSIASSLQVSESEDELGRLVMVTCGSVGAHWVDADRALAGSYDAHGCASPRFERSAS